MKSKAGNKLKKVRGWALAGSLALTGCLMDPEPKAVQVDHQAPESCSHEDSTTFTDSSEVTHMSCTVGEPQPPRAPK